MTKPALNPSQMPQHHPSPKEPARLRSLAETDLLDSPAEEGFDRITRLAQQLFGVSSAAVSLIAEDRQFLKSIAGDLEVNVPRSSSFCAHTILDPDVMIVEDATKDARFDQNASVLGGPRIRFYAGQPLQGPGGHNIGALCIIDQKPRTLDAKQQQILRDLAAIVQREITVRTDLRTGAKIQRAHLPESVPIIPGYSITSVSRPAGELSGDFYDWQDIEGTSRFVLADVMGKGTGPAILAATIRAGLRSATINDVGSAFAKVSEEMLTALARTESFATAFQMDLNPTTGVIRYADAGHGLTHHIPQKGFARRLPTTSVPLGIIAGDHWQTNRLTLLPGEALLIPSDGVLDLFDENLDRLAAEARNLAFTADLPAMLETLVDHKGTAADDVTILIIRREPSPDAGLGPN